MRLANAQTAQTVLEAIKATLFPLEGGWPALREADPDQEEREEWKRRAEVALAEYLPGAFSLNSCRAEGSLFSFLLYRFEERGPAPVSLR